MADDLDKLAPIALVAFAGNVGREVLEEGGKLATRLRLIYFLPPVVL